MQIPEIVFERSAGENLLLTIAIPTFNRRELLLGLLKQLEVLLAELRFSVHVEILISDNASTDDTSSALAEYAEGNVLRNIRIQRHEKNVGTDLNFLSLIVAARGAYFWLMSDDDRFVADGFQKLIGIIASANPPEFLLINQLTMSGNGKRYFDWRDESVENLDQFVGDVYSYLTFVGIIVFRRRDIDFRVYEKYSGTLLLISYVFIDSVLASSAPGLRMSDPAISYKPDNTGGYALFGVFCDEFGKVLKYARSRGASRKTIAAVANMHLRRFLMGAILLYRKNLYLKKENFKLEPRWRVLRRLFQFSIAYPSSYGRLFTSVGLLYMPYRLISVLLPALRNFGRWI